MSYIWENESWPNFEFGDSSVAAALSHLNKEKQMTDIAYSLIDNQTRNQLIARNLSADIVSSLSIEGESIDVDSVYSSVSKHLDVAFTGKSKDSAYAQSIFEMVTDALDNHEPLSHERLFTWNRKLFENKAGIRPKTMGNYRKDIEYVMKTSGKTQEVIYEAVKPEKIHSEMERLLSFINDTNTLNPFVKAAVASLWFIIIHPFEDGNGRISRAIADYIISMNSNNAFHAFNISTGILKNRNSYYDQIRKVSKDNPGMDISNWVSWFLKMVADCIFQSRIELMRTLATTAFMKTLDPNEFNSREMSMLYKLADGSFFGKLTTDKWKKMTKCSGAVAFRDIQHLVREGFLIPTDDAGKNKGYVFNSKVANRQ
ncbi:Fic family protein [Treponema parvum]|uniref:Fic family protein n=1 Tax=Treponema parvum TaxID=138851 RepID=A0A975IE26_9SPIR|nr:DUF4172 domain-containing protein [Treponema parvum]QTQ13422.1 Fic family protein [Treponema parvum]